MNFSSPVHWPCWIWSSWPSTIILFLCARRRQHMPRAPFHSPVQISALILCPLGCAEMSLSSPASLHGHVGAAGAHLAVTCTDGSCCSTLAFTWGNQGCLHSIAAPPRQNSPEFAPLSHLFWLLGSSHQQSSPQSPLPAAPGFVQPFTPT